MVDGVTDIADKRIDVLIRTLRKADATEEENERLQFECAGQIRDLLAGEWSTRKLAAELKARGYVSPKTGKPMSYHSIRIYGRAAGYQGSQSWADAFALAKAGATEEEAEEIMEEAAATGKAASTVANRKRQRQAAEGKLKVPAGKSAPAILGLLAEAAEKEEGLSFSDMDQILRLNPNEAHVESTVRHLCADLAKAGWIVKDEVNTKKSVRTGLPVAVWYLSEDGALQFGLDHGWKGKKKRRSSTTSSRSKAKPDETADERRQRLEREAIKAAEEEFKDRQSGAARFRSSLADWQRWIGGARNLQGLVDNEKYSCPPATQEVLLQTLDRFIEIASETAEALRRHQAAPVDMGYYKVLGVKPEATAAAIKTAYRDLARKYHPDINGGNDEKFKAIATAYTWLSDPEKRRQYNSYGVQK